MTVDHLVVHADASVGQVHAQFVAQLAGDDHRLGNNFTRQRIDFAGVNDLIVDRHNGSTNEVEAVGVVGHGQTEVVVTRNRRARVPRTLNTKVGHVKRLAALVGEGFLEPQNNVDRSETIGEEGLGIGSEKRRVERGDVGLQASNRFLNFQPVAVNVPVRRPVAVAVVETEMGTVRLNFGQRDDTCVWSQRGHDLPVKGSLEVGSFKDDVNQATVRCFTAR